MSGSSWLNVTELTSQESLFATARALSFATVKHPQICNRTRCSHGDQREWGKSHFEIHPAVEQDHQVVISEHESGSVLDINEELNRTSKENDQREQQRHHRVLLQKNLRRELRRSSKKHNQAQKKKYF
nr:uncharacterized protein LOC131770834 isoform X1 [Pocillopora verrucosa]